VTGFGPFPGMARNPSAELARRVAASPRWRRLGIDAQSLILPTTYAALNQVLEPALRRAPPHAVLMIGVAGRTRHIRIEGRAVNRASLMPDAAGQRPDSPTLAKGPASRRLRLSPVPLRALLRRHGIPCRISQDAGRYLCNALYYRALAGPRPVLFIHIPKLPTATHKRQNASVPRRLSWGDALAAALVDAAALTLRGERRPSPVAGLSPAD
jgi:pyroglutamyl-peptidase